MYKRKKKEGTRIGFLFVWGNENRGRRGANCTSVFYFVILFADDILPAWASFFKSYSRNDNLQKKVYLLIDINKLFKECGNFKLSNTQRNRNLQKLKEKGRS